MKFILLILAFSAFTLRSQTLEGQIIDSSNQTAIPFAEIYIFELDLHTQSDDNGMFSISAQLPNSYQILITASNYEFYKATLSNVSNEIIKFYLTESHHKLEEVIVSGPKGTLQRNNAVHIERMSLKDLNQISNTTLAEAISKIPGVYSASTGLGISKPVIRGMQGIRVVSMLNGLRIENQQWGGDHGLGITSLGIGSVEVIKGPSSLLYGADALGGVIYYVDEKYAAQNKTEIGFSTQNETNTLGTTNQIWFKKSGNNIRFNLGASLSSHADYRLPNNRFAANSRFRDQSIKSSFGWNRSKGVLNIRYTYNTTNVGIPGHTHEDIIKESKLKVANQSREQRLPYQDFQNHYLSVDNKWFVEKGEVQLLLGQTLNRLTEFEEKVTIPGIKMDLYNSLYHLKYKRNVNKKLSYIGGIQGMYQMNLNDIKATEVLLPKSSMLDNGAYFIAYYNLKYWNLQAGVRYDQRIINTDEIFKGNDPFNQTYDGMNFSLGAVRNKSKYTYRANISSGYRAPHLSELLANGFHHGTLRYEIGNLNLKSENATQLDLTFERHGDHLELIINPFYNYVQNFTFINPIDSLIDGLPVFVYDQLTDVQMYGVDLGLHFHPHFAHWLHVEASYSFLESHSERQISLMPQNRILSGLRFDFQDISIFKSNKLVFDYNYFFKQDRISEMETKSPFYQLLNIGINTSIGEKERFDLSFGCKNLLNTEFIDHLSRLKNIGLESPGRNIYFKLTYQFSN
jgi:iron complex outermembrane recepter protein